MWKGTFFPAKLYDSVRKEVLELIAGPSNGPTGITADHVDDLKVATAPKLVTFMSTGAVQKVKHGLDVVPRAVAISSFKAPRGDSGALMPTEIVVGAVTDADLTVTSVAGTEITLLVYPPYRFPA